MAKVGRKLMFLVKDPFGGVNTVKERLGNRKKVSSLREEFANNFNV